MEFFLDFQKEFYEVRLDEVSSIFECMKRRVFEIFLVFFTVAKRHNTIISRMPEVNGSHLRQYTRETHRVDRKGSRRLSHESAIIKYGSHKVEGIYMSWKLVF